MTPLVTWFRASIKPYLTRLIDYTQTRSQTYLPSSRTYNQVAEFRRTSVSTGAIMFKLPTIFSAQNAMLKFTFSWYNYKTNTSGTLVASGYIYINKTWINLSDSWSTDIDSPFNSITFSSLPNEGDRWCIVLGEVDTAWSYINMKLDKLEVSHAHLTGWDIGWETELVTDLSVLSTATNATKTLKTTNNTWNVDTWANTFRNYASGYVICRATCKDNIVTLEGLARCDSQDIRNKDIFFLPPHMRPKARHIFTTVASGTIVRIDVLNTGAVRVVQTKTATWVSISGITFTTVDY